MSLGAVDQMGRQCRVSRASSASRWLFELFWLPSTSTRSASRRKPRHRLLAILRRVADVVLRRRGDLREPLLQPA